ncbi:hypothetical protein BpHYR1_018604 [Brachionus plicatilis]|uniref:Uncharacterized protein n=1 Tax=Brachionus plicatilis TaxID=10195 RepID=A0A3M7R6S5_BRAPC|nr:hypothetical protein BpHYR1_018604 [Brachionus plicatilis]
MECYNTKQKAFKFDYKLAEQLLWPWSSLPHRSDSKSCYLFSISFFYSETKFLSASQLNKENELFQFFAVWSNT